jgi:hypothetical protein
MRRGYRQPVGIAHKGFAGRTNMSNHIARSSVISRLSAALAFLGLVAAPLVAGDVRVFPSKDVDLSLYKTYTLLPPRVLTKSGIKENEPTVSPLLLAALRKELSGKGLAEVTEGADLEVSSGAMAVSIPQIELLIYSLTLEGTSMTGTAPLASIGRYNREGTLIVNLIDTRTKRTAWLGIASRALGKPSKLKRDIDKATNALFKKYPAIK